MQHRHEIDGLRAIAVIPVILFHAGFTVFSGGYVGVDVFFVISGYLITSIIISELESGSFSILRFYERRARRILPALFFVVLACIPLAWIWMIPSQFKEFADSIMAVTVFASNILFWRESGYFAAEAGEKPLLHTWSLAVEEQYYMLFPLLLIGLWRFGRNPVFYVILGMSAISLAASEWGWRNEPEANFYLAPTRAWELLAGSLAAFLQVGRPVRSHNLLSVLGLGLIVFSIFYFDEDTPFPSAYALAPVVGTILVIRFGTSGTWVARLLSLKAFVGVGLISYSAYLWHQPLFAFARIRHLDEPSQLVMSALAILSLILAYFSWRFVEQPFRRKSGILVGSRAKLFSLVGVCSVALLAFGAFAHVKDGFEGRMDKYDVAGYEWDNHQLMRASWRYLSEMSGGRRYSVEENSFDNTFWFPMRSDKRRLMIVGNSHSKGLFNILTNSNHTAQNYLVTRYGVQLRDLTPSHQIFSSLNFYTSDYIIIATQYTRADMNALIDVIAMIRKLGKTPVLTTNIPEFVGDKALNLADSVIRPLVAAGESAFSQDALFELNRMHWTSAMQDSWVLEKNRWIRAIAKEHDVLLLDRWELQCDAEQEICFGSSQAFEKYYFDYGHITLTGAAFFGQRIDALNWLEPLR